MTLLDQTALDQTALDQTALDRTTGLQATPGPPQPTNKAATRRALLVWDAPNLDMGLGSILGGRPTAAHRPRFDALGRWLLARTAELLAPHGRAVVEVSSPGTGSHRYRARIESGGSTSAWFPWARVSADDIAHLSHRAGLRLETTTSDGGRWFATLARAAR